MPKRPKGDKTTPAATATTTTASTQNNHKEPAAASPATVVTPTAPVSGVARTQSANHNNDPGHEAEDHEHDDITEESEKNARKIKEKKHDAGAADLERVTDYAGEEREISASDISAVMGLVVEEMANQSAKENELLKVKIRKEDVDLLVREFEISEEKAERSLREHIGNLMETLQTLTN